MAQAPNCTWQLLRRVAIMHVHAPPAGTSKHCSKLSTHQPAATRDRWNSCMPLHGVPPGRAQDHQQSVPAKGLVAVHSSNKAGGHLPATPLTHLACVQTSAHQGQQACTT